MNARDRLAAIAARAEAATDGPWESYVTMSAEPVVTQQGKGAFGVVLKAAHGQDDYGFDDVIFAAHARTDVPALVAFATAVLDETRFAVGDECDILAAEIRRLADEHLGGTS